MDSPWRWFVKSLTVSPGVVEASRDGALNTYRRLGGVNQQVNAAWMEAQSASYAWMYRTQPAVRTVVDFHARNIAQLPLKLYERVSDTDRQRITDHPALQTMKRPNQDTPGDRFIYNLLVDFLVHENAYVLKFSQGPRQPLTLVKIPPPSVAVLSAARYVVEAYRIFRSDGTYIDVSPENVIHWRGSNPEDARIGLSKLETLRQVLAEEVAAQRASIELTKSGLQLPGYIKRPLDAPLLSEDARKRFEESWANRAKGATKKTPLLEEGMEFVEGTISPKDAELLASRRFTIEEVARVYGLPLGVIGLEPSSDLAEQRRQVYADVLPPLTGELACRLDLSILEQEYREDGLYYEFDLNSKLEGDLENRFPALTASAGRPWQTVNEVRAKENLPPIDGGDDLTIPLNVMIEGQGSPALPAPNVMPPQDANEPPQDGSYREQAISGNGHKAAHLIPRRAALANRRDGYAETLTGVLTRNFNRQERVVKSARKALDEARFNPELAADLLKEARHIVATEGGIASARIAKDFDNARVQHYLEAATSQSAAEINAFTAKELRDRDPSEVFAAAKNQRAPANGMAMATAFAAFSTREAIAQSGQKRTVAVAGGDCPICEPYQGTWEAESLDAWPPYHPSCNCVADIAA